MAFNNNQNDQTLPVDGRGKITGNDLLPKYFRTDTNKKFISSTIDQMIRPGVTEKVNFFAGRRTSKAREDNDIYLPDVTKERQDYQFEPVALYKDSLGNVKYTKDYNDYLGVLRTFNGKVDNHNLLNSQENYAWNSHIDWDKFSNFREYFWLPLGPQPVGVAGTVRDVESTYTVGLALDDDNYAYVFTPNGFTRNPTLKLYKGQLYRFEIDCPGQPMTISTTRTAEDIDPFFGVELLDPQTIYDKGVVKYEYDAEGKLVLSDKDYIEKGVIEFLVPDDVPDSLFYISDNDPNTSGIMLFYGIEENSEIDVDEEVVGKKTYTLNNGTKLSNGMKVFFQGTVTPEKYSTGYWYVEGVGTAIRLVSENDLKVPAVYTSDTDVSFDDTGYDDFPLDTSLSYPASKDYITMNRASADRNPWSRYNRWFHKSVIETSASLNGIDVSFDEDARAKRPILEFDAGLQLFQHGSKAKADVNLVDDFTTDIFSTIEGSIGYNVDGVDLQDGMRVLFTADTDILVNSRIYDIKFITHNGRRQITLVEAEDSQYSDGDCVLALDGSSYKGKMFYWRDGTYNLSQDKTQLNQFPLFDLFDKDGNSFSDLIAYPDSSFAGNRVFSYATGNGTVDDELGFSLLYRNIVNVGDIVFDFNLLQDSFIYQGSEGLDESKSTDLGFVKVFDSSGINFSYENAWKKTNRLSEQAVIKQYIIDSSNNELLVDVFQNSFSLDDLVVKVFVDNVRKIKDVDYEILAKGTTAQISFFDSLEIGSNVILKCYSSASKTDNGFYEIPSNFEKNPLNDNILTFTLGEVNDHIGSIVENHPEFSGNYPGDSNLRDLGNRTSYGRRFIQSSGPLNLPLFHLTEKESNIVKSIQFAKDSYSKFKRRFIFEASNSGFTGPVKEHVDRILSDISKDIVSPRPYFFSDMVGLNASLRTVHTVEYPGPAYFQISTDFNLTDLSSRAVYVYRNSEQLLYGRDYTFSENFVYVTREDLTEGDVVIVYEYESTNGSFIPPTPTKLGLYPKYEPMKMVDYTAAEGTVNVIQGHDGSITVAYNDYRDDLILELETRIFNNIKTEYNIDLIDIHDFIPSKYRDTGFKKSDIDNLIVKDFNRWLEVANNPDYSSIDDIFDKDNSLTYNYSLMTGQDNEQLQGYWRNVYMEYYDTDRPHTHPWEMIGFTIKPTWWEEVYGPAPYTRDNLVLWQDMSRGEVKAPNSPVEIREKYIRPTLMNHIPANEYGRLASPLESGLANNFVLQRSKIPFAFGDVSPVEGAWRRSSEYPFSIISAWCILQPAKIMGIGFDLSRIERNIAGNIVYKTTQKSLQLSKLEFPTVYNTTDLSKVTLAAGLVSYVSNYLVGQDNDLYKEYQEKLSGLSNQLGVKLGGFADKNKLKLLLDSRSPLNKTSVFVPEENYDLVLRKSAPQDGAVFSGIIIEDVGTGYVINGYDKEFPLFKYNPKIERADDKAVTVGGISESFVEWGENQTYVSGTVVRNEGVFYRTKVTHESESSFDITKFAFLAELPIEGGVTATIARQFSTEEDILPYGTKLSTVQEVVDFLLGYENSLRQKGFSFEYYNTETEALEDMLLCVKEFMFWSIQSWGTGSVITISPAANQVSFNRDFFVVDDVYDSFFDFQLLAGNGSRLSTNFTSVFREDNTFGIRPIGTDEGVYLIKLPLVQVEHMILVDNTTVFADNIYQLSTGYRQERIKLVGYRTDGWNGSLSIPGFFYDEAEVTEWSTYTDYALGDIVKYKEFYYSANLKHSSTDVFDSNNWYRLSEPPESQLFPNWDYKAIQFTDFYDLDTDNFDTEQQRLGQHLIGYQPREYLSNIITDSVSQYKFYQGFIQEKGTLNSLTRLFDPLSKTDADALEFFEEWAIRTGRYGATENVQELEYQLDEESYRLEPQLFELTTNLTNRTDLVVEIPEYSVYLKPNNYNHEPFVDETGKKLVAKDNGYTRLSDVSFVSNGFDSITSLNILGVTAGEFIWVTNEKLSWNIYRIIQADELEIVRFEIDLPDGQQLDENNEFLNGFTAYFDGYQDIQVGDIIGIRADGAVNGFYKVHSRALSGDSTAETQIGFLSENPVSDTNQFPSSSSMVFYRLEERRFDTVQDVNESIVDLREDEKDTVWIDDTGSGTWAVYENDNVYSLLEEIANPVDSFNSFGHSVSASKNNHTLIVGSPEYNDGMMRVYTRYSEKLSLSLLQEVVGSSLTDSGSKYGYSVDISPNGRFVAVGAPLASNAVSRFRGELQQTSDDSVNYAAGDIVYERLGLWRANTSIDGWAVDGTDSSTISTTDQDWDQVYLIEADDTGQTSGLSQQGVVYLYELDLNGVYELKHIVLSPYPTENEQFGYKVRIRQTAEGHYRLFVGAPNPDGNTHLGFPEVNPGGRIYILDNSVSNEWRYDIDPRYRGAWDVLRNYNEGEVVYYEGLIYIASTNISSGNQPPNYSSLWLDLDNNDDNFNNDYKSIFPYLPPRLHDGSQAELDSGQFLLPGDQSLNNFGQNFDTNIYGDVIAATYSDDTYINVLAFTNDGNTWNSQTQLTDSDLDPSNDFGADLAVNDKGDKIAISAPRSDETELDAGSVRIYTQSTDNDGVITFEYSQTLTSFFKERSESFGTGVDFGDNCLIVSSKNADRVVQTTFDKYTGYLVEEIDDSTLIIGNETSIVAEIGDPDSPESERPTLFDGGSCKFISTKKDTGRLLKFQEIGDSYLYGEDIAYNRDTSYNDLSNFFVSSNHVYVGLPNFNPSSIDDEGIYNRYSEVDAKGVVTDLRRDAGEFSWTLKTSQTQKADVYKVARTFLYDKVTEDLIAELDVIDPRQGRIAGPADAELTFKTYYDPAVYSVNTIDSTGNIQDGVTVDPVSNWTDNYVGKLWWDLSTASWYNPYQGDIHYRASTFNTLIPGSRIDVYEWVSTSILPSKWVEASNTPQGVLDGVSGIPLYGDNVYSSKRVYDESTKQFVEKYYYWVKSKRTLPTISTTRRLTGYQVESLIGYPAEAGYRYVALLGNDAFAVYNSSSFVNSTNTVLHFDLLEDQELKTNRHNEYSILSEGLATSRIDDIIEQKWIDSLVGYDISNRLVPDPLLPAKQRYGILNYPRQGMFVNRYEAIKQVVERANSVLLKEQIVDNYDLSTLLSLDPTPGTASGLYDVVVEDLDQLEFVGVAKTRQAILRPIVVNTKIVDVVVDDSGSGYRYPPTILINDTFGRDAVINTVINSRGEVTGANIRSQGNNYTQDAEIIVRKFSVLVQSDAEIGGRWSIYEWNSTASMFDRSLSQSFNTTLYWSYVDWYAEGYNSETAIDFVVEQSYEIFTVNDSVGNVLKVNNIGTGGWLLLEKVNNQVTEDYTVNYRVIGRENGTIQLSDQLYLFASRGGGYDAGIYDRNLYDREPIQELRNTIFTLKEDLFINDLAPEYNKLFFSSVRYVLQEQPNVDWVFKTSFVKAKHNFGDLEQKLNFQNDNLENYQDYVSEVKPYTTKVREYVSAYGNTDNTNSLVTDFDLPPSYNEVTKDIEVSEAKLFEDTVTNVLDKYLEYPFKSWVDNNAYELTDIVVVDPGEGYIYTPLVTVEGDNGSTAQAYTSQGRVSSIEIVEKGGSYYSPPVISISGNLREGGREARAIAIIGNGVVRNNHIVMKFDRTSGTYFITDINQTENFVGTETTEVFNLEWPVDLRTNTFSVLINGIELLSTRYTIENVLDTSKGYDRYKGKVTFVEAPDLDDAITVVYKKDIKLLHAADRINFFYNPKSGMAGKDLSQLMDGVEYQGAIYDTIDFSTEQGFGTGGFASDPWDIFEEVDGDEVFILDGSTTVFEMSEPFEDGVEYNVYIKYSGSSSFIRIDDPEYDATTVLANTNAQLQTITGDGVTTTLVVDPVDVPTAPGDTVIIRKSTSDGSFSLTYINYDTSLSGGDLAYTTATGVASEDINVDGDGFVTPTTSKGPEEIVPGQVIDTLDIQVYHNIIGGVGIVGVANYQLDTEIVFALPSRPQSDEGVIVKIDNVIQPTSLYSINWETQELVFADSTILTGNLLTIITIGTNGTDLADSNIEIFDGSTLSYYSIAKFSQDISAFVTINGLVATDGLEYSLVEGTLEEGHLNRVKIVLDPLYVQEGDVVRWTIYNSELQTYSQVRVDRTFQADGVNNYHIFDGTDNPIPFNDLPLAGNVMVKVNNQILQPGYSITYTTEAGRDEYEIDAWQFLDETVAEEFVYVFVDGVQYDNSQFSFNPAENKVVFSVGNVPDAGKKLSIQVIKRADYYFLDTQIVATTLADEAIDLEPILSAGDIVTVSTSANDYEVLVVSVEDDTFVIQSLQTDIRDDWVANQEIVISVNDSDSTTIKGASVQYVASSNLTLDNTPLSGDTIEIYTFSNHDPNDFRRLVYDIDSEIMIESSDSGYVDSNLLTAGIVKLQGNVSEAQYAWVFVDGILKSPNIDYIIDKDLNAVRLTDYPNNDSVIDVLYFGGQPYQPRFGFRIFKDMLNRTHYKRLNERNSYVLAQPLNYYDNYIYLKDSSGIQLPNKETNTPGVLFIDKERVEFFEVEGNRLSQLRRGTLGTGVKDVYPEDCRVYGQGREENINYKDTITKQTVISASSIETLYGDGSTVFVTLSTDLNLRSITSVKLNDVVTTEYTLNGSVLEFEDVLQQDDKVTVSYLPIGIELDQPASSINELEVYVGGKRLIKNSYTGFDPTLGQDNSEGDITVDADFTLDGNVVKFTTAIPDSRRVEIVRKVGEVWNETGKSLADSNNPISVFLRDATIELPK